MEHGCLVSPLSYHWLGCVTLAGWVLWAPHSALGPARCDMQAHAKQAAGESTVVDFEDEALTDSCHEPRLHKSCATYRGSDGGPDDQRRRLGTSGHGPS